MKRVFAAMMIVGMALLAGCGGSFEWFPSNNQNGSLSPKPSSDLAVDVQADTVIDSSYFKTLPYQVRFNNQTTHSSSATISISGDTTSEYSIDGGNSWHGTSSSPGRVTGGSYVYVRHVSSNLGENRSIVSTLNIGGNQATYTSKTGSLIFRTLNVTAGSTIPVKSDIVAVPLTPPNGFTYGSPTTIAFTADSDPSSKMYIGGDFYPSPSTIVAGKTLYFTHTAGATSGSIVTTKALLTGNNNTTYTVTFKSKAN